MPPEAFAPNPLKQKILHALDAEVAENVDRIHLKILFSHDIFPVSMGNMIHRLL